jgi:multidrug efflux pump subunit AcrA (membrane-fusion protein)
MFGLLAGLILFSSTAISAVSTPPTKDKPTVIVEEIKVQEDFKRILVPVKVEAKVRSQVSAEVEGWITKIVKPLGSKVNKGETVLIIENKDPAFTYAAVRVRSPVSGVVSQMDPSLMSRVARGDKLFSVIDASAIKLTAEIPGGEIQLLKQGTIGAYRSDLNAVESLDVKLIGVSPLIDPRTGTASAEMEFLAKKKLPVIGSVGNVLFEISRGKILLVPESTIGFLDGTASVKVVGKDGKIEKKSVEVGDQKESNVVILSGLTSGDKIVLRSSRPIKEGENVTVENTEK